MRAPRALLFSDLDGTLLDAGYRPGPAAEALRRLREAGVETIPCSSKTRAEQEPLRALLGLGSALVVENGAAVVLKRDAATPLLPTSRAGGDATVVLGVPAEQVRRALAAARRRLGVDFVMYSELSDPRLSSLSGLEPSAASRARQREYSETVVGLAEAEASRLAEALRPGFTLVSGGRFHTAGSSAADKGRALRWLTALYRRAFGALEVYAVGDAANDAGMLRAADHAYFVRRPDGSHAALPGTPLDGVGPLGWVELAERLLARFRAP